MNDKLLFKNKYRIQSTRLVGWDYSSNGIYFITINTKFGKNYFGKIINKKMYLNNIGKIIKKYWYEIPNHFSNIKLDEFIVMPNHIHGIIIITSRDDGTASSPIQTETSLSKDDGTASSLSQIGTSSQPQTETLLNNNNNNNEKIDIDKEINEGIDIDKNFESLSHKDLSFSSGVKKRDKAMPCLYRQRGSISSIIGAYKSICTRKINEFYPEIYFKWHIRFYDRIIRNEKEFNNVRNYIIKNPENYKTKIRSS